MANINNDGTKNNLIKIIIKLLRNFNKIPKPSGFISSAGILIIFSLIIGSANAQETSCEWTITHDSIWYGIHWSLNSSTALWDANGDNNFLTRTIQLPSSSNLVLEYDYRVHEAGSPESGCSGKGIEWWGNHTHLMVYVNGNKVKTHWGKWEIGQLGKQGGPFPDSIDLSSYSGQNVEIKFQASGYSSMDSRPYGDYKCWCGCGIGVMNIKINANGNIIPLLPCTGESKPDLTVKSLTLNPQNPTQNQSVIITTVIKNQGTAIANDVRVNFYVDGTLYTEEKNSFNGYRIIPSINGGSEKIISFEWTADAGSHELKVVVDPYDKIDESNENNNEISKNSDYNQEGDSPVVLEIKPQFWGTFIHGVDLNNNIEAKVSDPDGSEDITKVVFSIEGDSYSKTYTDANGGDGWWWAGLNVGEVPDGAILKVVAYDKSGHESKTKILQFKEITMPDWLKPTITIKGIEMGACTSQFIVNELAFEFECNYDLSKFGSGEFTIPENMPVFGGEQNIKAPKVKFYAKYYINGFGEIGGGVGYSDIDLFGGQFKIYGGVSGTVDPDLNLIEFLAFIEFTLKYEIPTAWAIYLPVIGNQGFVVVVEPHGKIEAECNSQPPDNSLQLDKIFAEIGIGGGGKFKLGDEDGNVVSAYFEVYILGDGTIVIVIYEPSHDPVFYIDNAELSIRAGVTGRVGWGWFKAEYNREIGPYKWTIYQSESSTGGSTGGGGLLLTSYVQVTNNNGGVVGTYKLFSLNDSDENFNFYGNSPINALTYDTSPDDMPHLTTDKSGNSMLVWVHTTNTSSTPPKMDVYYSIWGGNSWSTPGPIAVNNNLELNPVVTYDSYGDAVAVWTSDKGANISEDFDAWVSDLEIYYSKWNGTNWTEPKTITNNTQGDGKASISADNNGNIISAWVNDNDGNISTKNDTEIYYSTWNGSDWSASAAITNNEIQDTGPSVAYNSHGDAVVIWTQDIDSNSSTTNDREIYYSIWNGTAWNNPKPVTNNSLNDRMASIAFDSNNNARIVWVQDNISAITIDNGTSNITVNVTKSIVYSTILNKTGQLSVPEQVSNAKNWIRNPVVSFDSKGNAVVAWEGQGAGDGLGDIYYSVMDNLTNFWSFPMMITKDALSDSHVSLSVDSNDNSMIVWLRHNESITCNGNISNNNTNCSFLSEDDEIYYSAIPIEADLFLTQNDIRFNKNNTFAIGDNITINATIKNIGVLKAESIRVHFYNGNPATGGTLIENKIINSILAGENKTIFTNLTITNANHEIFVKIDPLNNIPEINETNNIASKSLSVLPDLTLYNADITFSNDNPFVGDNISINATIHNIGNLLASNITVYFYEGNPDDNGTLIGNTTLNSVIPEGIGTASIIWTAHEGNHNIFVVIDPLDSVMEINESNNEAVNYIKILPDLTLDAIDIIFSDDRPKVGDNINITAAIHNAGTVDASTVNVLFYDGNPIRSGTLIGNKTINTVTANSKTNVSITFNATSGNHEIYIYIDKQNKINERNEFNNIALNQLIVSLKPDLSLTSSDVHYDLPLVGKNITINATIHNIGYTDVNNTKIALIINNTTINSTTVNIPANSQANVTFNWTAIQGIHDLTIAADPDNEINESYEFNNNLTMQIFVVDAFISDEAIITAPAEVKLDEEFNASLFLKNTGTLDMENVSVHLILSQEFNTTDDTEINLGNFSVSEERTINWTLKGIKAGYGGILINITSQDNWSDAVNKSIYCFTCDINNDGITLHDYTDLMTTYKCFLGINKNCKINSQDWTLLKQEYNCFVNNKQI